MIKSQQEMIFTKQDQIQSTLHGETSVIQSPTASVLAFSPPFTPPTTSIRDSFKRNTKEPLQPYQPEASDLTSIFSESDLDSLLSSFDWVAPLQSQAEQSQLEDATVAAGTPKDPHPGTFDTGIVHCSVDTAGTPHCSMDTAGIVHCLMDTAGTLHRSMDTAETHSMDIAGMTLHPSMDTGTVYMYHLMLELHSTKQLLLEIRFNDCWNFTMWNR